LVLGILGLVCFGLFTGIPAVICGHTAQSKIRRSAGALTGEGLALGGLITGYISIALSVLMIPLMLAIAIPNFVKARETAQRNACINNLRSLDGATQQWALEYSKPDDAVPTFAELDRFFKGATSLFTCPAGGTYTLGPVSGKPTCSVPGHALEDWRLQEPLIEERTR
jgi:hypothetical protein